MAVHERVTSWVLQVLETDARKRIRVLTVVVAALVTIVMWAVHFRYPYLFKELLHSKREIKFLSALVLAPPFVAAFSIGYLIYPQAAETANNESGPMSGYFYQRSADRKWKIAIAAGIVAAVNFLLMFITSDL